MQIEEDKQVNWVLKYDDEQRQTLKHISIRNWKDELSYGNLRHVYKLAEVDLLNKDATKYGTVVWSSSGVSQFLQLYGLPEDSPLSVLVVEILPTITNIYEHLSGLHKPEVAVGLSGTVSLADVPDEGMIKECTVQMVRAQMTQLPPSPVNEALGHHRILRTSPLTEVPFVCCTNY